MCFRPSEVNLNQPIKCPLCGKVNRPDAVECVKCGATEADMMAALAEAPADSTAADGKAPNAPVAPVKPGPPKAPTAPGALGS